MSIEILPVELKVAILRCSPDLSTLRSLVQSSPTYHEAYLGRRSYILAHVLQNDLEPGALFDACAVYEASLITTAITQSKKAVEDWLISYKEKRSKIPDLSSLPEEQIVAMTCYHFSIISPIAPQYCSTVLGHSPLTGEIIPLVEPSHTEMARVQRALYRFDLFGILFPRYHSESISDVPDLPSFSYMDISKKFFGIYHEWEVEEIASISEYLTCCYTELIRYYFAALIQRSHERLGASDYLEEPHEGKCLPFAAFTRSILITILDSPLSVIVSKFEDEIEACISKGLSFYYNLMRLPSGQVQYNALESVLEEDSMALSTTLQFYERDIVRGVRKRDNADLTFDDEEKGPNAAWSWIIARRNEGARVDLEDLRVWGFVMWDRERLDSWKVLREDPKDVNVLNWGMQMRWGVEIDTQVEIPSLPTVVE